MIFYSSSYGRIWASLCFCSWFVLSRLILNHFLSCFPTHKLYLFNLRCSVLLSSQFFFDDMIFYIYVSTQLYFRLSFSLRSFHMLVSCSESLRFSLNITKWLIWSFFIPCIFFLLSHTYLRRNAMHDDTPRSLYSYSWNCRKHERKLGYLKNTKHTQHMKRS